MKKVQQHRFAIHVSKAFSSNSEHAQRLYDYSSKHWLLFTPILSFGRSKRGMPLSCLLNYIEDTAEGLVDNLSETNWLLCLVAVLASVLVFVQQTINLQVLCLTSKSTMRVLLHIGKVVLVGVLMLLLLVYWPS
jgi:hypothetical protein